MFLNVFWSFGEHKLFSCIGVCALEFSPSATPRKNICMGEQEAANRQFELLTPKQKQLRSNSNVQNVLFLQ